jgi:hypothetical protein
MQLRTRPSALDVKIGFSVLRQLSILYRLTAKHRGLTGGFTRQSSQLKESHEELVLSIS